MPAFLYDVPVRIWLTDMNGSDTGRRNLPLSDSDFKVWRGATNSVEFVVRDNDRKPKSLENKTAMITVMDPFSKFTRLQKPLDIIDEGRGTVSLTLEPQEIHDWKTGTYNYSVLIQEDGIETLLAIDRNQNTVGNFEFFDSALPAEIESMKLEPSDFTEYSPNETETRHMSSMIEIDDTVMYHTAAIYGSEFTGTVWVWGSIESDPSSPGGNYENWFNLDESPIEFDNFTGIHALNIRSFDAKHIVFSWQEDDENEGSLESILVI